MAIHDFKCGTYFVTGVLEERGESGVSLTISEGTYSEVIMYPDFKKELKKQMVNFPIHGFFTIEVKSKDTTKEYVELTSLRSDTEPNNTQTKAEVRMVQQSECTKIATPLKVVRADYPEAPKKPYKKNKKMNLLNQPH